MPRSKVFFVQHTVWDDFFVTCSQSRPIYCGPVGILCLPFFHQFCTKLHKPQIISSNHGKTDEVRAGFSLILSVTSIHHVPALTSNKCITYLGVNLPPCLQRVSASWLPGRWLAKSRPGGTSTRAEPRCPIPSSPSQSGSLHIPTRRGSTER